MSQMGQTEKNSVRAYVLRFALELGHSSMQSALRFCAKADVARREALLSLLEHVHRETIGVNLAIPVGPKAIHLIALDTFDGHQWTS